MECTRDRLVASLSSIRRPSTQPEGEFFYVYEDLQRLLKKTDIVNLMKEHVLNQYLEKYANQIMSNGIRLFFVLMSMDELQHLESFLTHCILDLQLPMEDEVRIQKLAPDLDRVCFQKRQWQFFPWVFQKESGHLELSSGTILPFTEQEQIGKGSSATVQLVTIPLEQQNFFMDENDGNVKVVRKRITIHRDAKKATKEFHDERQCLELFSLLQHPSIVPLLGSFTLNGEHSLLFPHYARSLEHFFTNEGTFGKFSDSAILVGALHGLASALQTVHEVTLRSKITPDFYIKYGFHQDIRPENILLTDTRFILADFGLALSQPTPVPTHREWRANIGHYISPESMDPGFQSRDVGHLNDVWAFGCLISDMATYIARGKAGIEEFRRSRTTTSFYNERYSNGYFFDGNSLSLKPKVHDWLQNLSNDSDDSPIIPSLVALATELLKFRPGERLGMRAQTIRLSFIHAKVLFRAAVGAIEGLITGLKDLGLPFQSQSHVRLDLKRLETFGTCLKMHDKTTIDCANFEQESFATTVKNSLCLIISNYRVSQKMDWVKFSHETNNPESQPRPGVMCEIKRPNYVDNVTSEEIQKLVDLLPNQKYYSDLFQMMNIQPSVHDDLQVVVEHSQESPELYTNYALHKKLQRLSYELDNGLKNHSLDGENLHLNSANLSSSLEIFGRNHHLGTYQTNGSEHPRNVIVEWILISQFSQNEPEVERINKIFGLAKLLHSPKPPDFHTLQCIGFTSPREGTNGYGFIYPFPQEAQYGTKMHPVSLRSLLGERSKVITLDEKFRIAKAISNTIFQIHNQGWLHKDICSDNVIFFVNREALLPKAKLRALPCGPYILGFHHGRPEGDTFHSDNRSNAKEEDARLYRHPDCQSGNTRFRAAYDYYSLGVVLNELSYWSPAKDLGKEFEKKHVTGIELWKDKYGSMLDLMMGSHYTEAMKACFDASLNVSDDDERQRVTEQFYSNVVRRLDSCIVG